MTKLEDLIDFSKGYQRSNHPFYSFTEEKFIEMMSEAFYQQRIRCADAFSETFEEHDVYWDIVNAPKPEY